MRSSSRLGVPFALVEALFLFLGMRWRFPRAERKGLEARQLRLAVARARFAARRSPYFRELYRGMDIRDFFSLPTVGKREMMERLGDWTTSGIPREKIMDFCLAAEESRDFGRRLNGYVCVLSTGTSGARGVEMVSRREEILLKAAFLARFPLVAKERLRVAFILRVFSPGLKFHAFGHHVEYVDPLVPFQEMKRRIDEIDPNVLSGPPQALRLLAREKAKGRLSASPKRIVSYGETLWPDVRAEIAKAFGCRVDEIYKCTESAIAMPCGEGRLHVNEDLVLLETLDENGREVAPGRPCTRLLVTDLVKRSCPIIRYELNDIVTISKESCPCGSHFRVIESIQGRLDDLFWLPSATGEGLLPVLPDFIARAVVSYLPEALEWCAVEESPERVVVRVETEEGGVSPGHEAALSARLATVFAAAGCVVPSIAVEGASTGAGDLDRKFRRVRRAFDLPNPGRLG